LVGFLVGFLVGAIVVGVSVGAEVAKVGLKVTVFTAPLVKIAPYNPAINPIMTRKAKALKPLC
jgi:hypothetical protein